MNVGGTPGPYDPSTRSPAGRIGWTSGLVGFVVGAFLASFVWVQVLATFVDNERDANELVLLDGGPLPEPGEEQEEGTGAQRRVIQEGGQSGQEGEGAGPGGVDVGPGGTGPGGTGPGGTGAGARTGVADDVVLLGATVAESGIAQAFLGEVRLGMEAVRNRVNRAGGIHGRQLQVLYKDDGWNSGVGMRFIENLIVEDGVFAMAVSPSSEGLNAAANAGLFARHGVPVIGADGLNNSQFVVVEDHQELGLRRGQANQWVWPVASSTTTQAHIIMKDAWDRCQRESGCDTLRPAIVFGNTYRFGVEGAYAFNQAYKRLSGQDIPGFEPGGTACRSNSRFCGVSADAASYDTPRGSLQTACGSASLGGGECNFVLLLLEPATADTWMRNFRPAASWRPDGGCCGLAGAQPLFTENFARLCGEKCHTMFVWTGYNPVCCSPGNEDVAEFSRLLPPRADKNNQFTMGGYLGMTLLVEALEQAGRDLTRDRLVQVLNSTTLRTGLTHPDGLKWSAGNKYANVYARSRTIDSSGGTFKTFQSGAPFTKDPWPGQDNLLPGG